MTARTQLDLPIGVIREAPFRKESETSREAAALVRPRCRPQRERVRDYLVAMGTYGATRHEIAEKLNLPIQSVCGRLAELKQLGSVVESTTDRRLTPYQKWAAVWRAR